MRLNSDPRRQVPSLGCLLSVVLTFVSSWHCALTSVDPLVTSLPCVRISPPLESPFVSKGQGICYKAGRLLEAYKSSNTNPRAAFLNPVQYVSRGIRIENHTDLVYTSRELLDGLLQEAAISQTLPSNVIKDRPHVMSRLSYLFAYAAAPKRPSFCRAVANLLHVSMPRS